MNDKRQGVLLEWMLDKIEKNGRVDGSSFSIQFMLNYGTTISRFRMVTGTNTGNYFLMDESFPQEIKDEYFKDYQSGKGEKNE